MVNTAFDSRLLNSKFSEDVPDAKVLKHGTIDDPLRHVRTPSQSPLI